MVLSRKEQLILSTKVMRMEQKEAREFLKDKEIKISEREYYRILAKIKNHTKDRMFDICKNFSEYHIEKIDTFDIIHKKLWDMIHSKKKIIKMVKIDDEGTDNNGNPYHKVFNTPKEFEVPLETAEITKILKDITDLQLYRSAYEEVTKDVQEGMAIDLTKQLDEKEKKVEPKTINKKKESESKDD